MNRSPIFQILSFIAYILVQSMLFKNVVLFNMGFCFFYIAFILLLPIETSTVVLMFLAFAMGFFIDIFYNSLGLHAFALVLIGYLRNQWLNVITPQGDYEAGAAPLLSEYGLLWFLVYTMPLVFVHHLTLFLIESVGSMLFWHSIFKTICSLLFTMTVIVLLQYLSLRRKKI